MTPIERKARELLPCPFCGNEARMFVGYRADYDVKILCPRCGSEGDLYGADDFKGDDRQVWIDTAVAAWNRRTALTPPAGGLPELPELFEALDKATPGEWIADGVEVDAPADCEFHSLAVFEHGSGCRLEDEAEANASATCAAVNWLRANRDALSARAIATANVAQATEALRAEVEGYKAALELQTQNAMANGAAVAIAEARAERLAEALRWYEGQVNGCRKIGSIGDPYRNTLAADGGRRAHAALHPQEADNG